MRTDSSSPLSRIPGKIARRLQHHYYRWFQGRCHIYVHRGPFPPEQRLDCVFQRYERFEDVPQDVREAVVAYGGTKGLETDAFEIRDGAIMWVASSDGMPATVVFTRRGQYFRQWFVPLEGQDIVVFRLRTYPQFRGRGLAPSLMRHALHECMKDGNAAYIDCRVYNHPSIRSITKTGFKYVATMKPITREEAIGGREV